MKLERNKNLNKRAKIENLYRNSNVAIETLIGENPFEFVVMNEIKMKNFTNIK